MGTVTTDSWKIDDRKLHFLIDKSPLSLQTGLIPKYFSQN